jgi:hypothetical protein
VRRPFPASRARPEPAGGDRRIARAAIVAATLVGLCSGCGAGQREADSRSVAAGFLAAMGDGDTVAACALLADATREDLEYAEGKPCAPALASVDIAGGEVGEVSVWGDRAQAWTSTGTLFLVQLAAGWRVTAAGCTPSGDGYDCVLAA